MNWKFWRKKEIEVVEEETYVDVIVKTNVKKGVVKIVFDNEIVLNKTIYGSRFYDKYFIRYLIVGENSIKELILTSQSLDKETYINMEKAIYYELIPSTIEDYFIEHTVSVVKK